MLLYLIVSVVLAAALGYAIGRWVHAHSSEWEDGFVAGVEWCYKNKVLKKAPELKVIKGGKDVHKQTDA